MMVEDEIRNLSLYLFPRDLIEDGIAEKAPGEKFLFIERDLSFPNELFELKIRVVLFHADDTVLRPFRSEPGIAGDDHTAFPASQ